MRREPLASVLPGVVLALSLIGGFLAAAIVSGRTRRSQRRSATSVQLPNGKSVTFETVRRRGLPDNRRVQFNAIIFVSFGIWSAVLTFKGAPILGPIAAFVFVELALAGYRLSTITGHVVTDEAAAARVAQLLNDVCNQAGCPSPRVMLRVDAVRVAAVRRVRKQTTLVLSRSFVNETDDQALKALLAHEIVHIVRDDLKAARRRALVAVFAGAALVVVIGAVAPLPGIAGMPISFATAIVGIMATSAGLSPLNRSREERADLEGARLVGDPDAMARALIRAQALSDETRQRLFGPPPWRWLLSPLSWRMPTHPPLAKRIAHLKSMA